MKSLTGSTTTALGQRAVIFAMLVQLEFASGTTYFTNAGQDIEWSGQTWTSVAGVGSIGNLRETLTGEAIGVQLEFNALPSAWLQKALAEHVQGKNALIYFAVMDESYNVIEASLEFRGLIDIMPIQDRGQFSKIILTVENRTVDFARQLTRRYNNEDQHRDYPDDNFFSHVESMAEATIIWPHKDFFKR